MRHRPPVEALERWLSGRKRRFAKPLVGVNPARGFESPPLRLEPPGSDRTRPTPSLDGGSGVSRLTRSRSPSRQRPTGPAPIRPQTATQNATHLPPADADLAAV